MKLVKNSYYQKNKKKIIINSLKYYHLNKSYILKKHKEYRIKNKLEIKRKRKIQYLKNIILQKIKNRKWYIKNHKKVRKQHNLYRKLNKDKIKKYLNHKRKINISFKLRHSCKTRIYQALKGINKSKSTMKLIGCSIEQLKTYLESKFKKGMTWKNYGYYGWHIDHIKPCCKFDLAKESEQKKCFHYTNLQPLWMKENLSKGNYYEKM